MSFAVHRHDSQSHKLSAEQRRQAGHGDVHRYRRDADDDAEVRRRRVAD